MNLALHLIGLGLIGLGIIEKSLTPVIIGAIIQESGHCYAYARTGDPRQSPRYCVKPQLFFAYPLLGLIVLYIVLSK